MSKTAFKPNQRRWRLWAAAGLAGAGLLTAGALRLFLADGSESHLEGGKVIA